jgi:DNA-binding response OmpR family regulator
MIVEEDAASAHAIKDIVLAQGYEAYYIPNIFEKALNAISRLIPDLVLMSIGAADPQKSIRLAEEIYRLHSIPVVFVSSGQDEQANRGIVHKTPFDYIIKPVKDFELRSMIRITMLKHRINVEFKELAAAKEQFRSVIAHNFKSPLAALATTTQVLLERKKTLSNDELQYFLSEINKTSQGLYDITDSILQTPDLNITNPRSK